MNFASDNWAGAHPAIGEALMRHNQGFAPAYGASELDHAVERRFCEIFEREVAVFFVATGTAANALAIAAMARPGGVAFCHPDAHMMEDECGAPEFFSGGVRLHPAGGALGRIEPENLRRAMARIPAEFIHAGQPVGVSITQASEIGTIYSTGQIATIAGLCRENGVPLHMDGARFANALVALDTTPAEMTWKAGVDMVSFGGTKNGCWCAEALVFLKPELASQAHFLRKRSAQLFSKSRFIAAQFDAYLADDLWLANARHANAMAARLAEAVGNAARMRLAWEPQANEVFAIMDGAESARLKAAGAVFYDWNTPTGFDGLADGETIWRFVASFATTADEVERFAALVAQ